MSDFEPSKRGGRMATWSGGRFYPLDPRAAEICIDDMVVGVAREGRFANQSRDFYSVAEHSVILSCYVDPQFAREALLDDASEAWLRDLPTPLKHDPCMAPYRAAERKLMDAVHERFGITSTPESRRAIKDVENRLFVDEVEALMLYPDEFAAVREGVIGLGAEILALPWHQAANLFVARFAELFPEVVEEYSSVWVDVPA